MNEFFEKKKWVAEAPSNIALIKYMGKSDASINVATNTSISYTLPHLLSIVELEVVSREGGEDRWEPLREHKGRKLPATELSAKGITRFLAHLQKIKNHYDFKGAFVVRSANDFPSDCGLASSASSFAALTKVALVAVAELMGVESPTLAEGVSWSRKGSGSSCRSFFPHWAIWTQDRVADVPELAEFSNLIHQVVVVNNEVKAVSSSEAHRRVTSSLLFAGRPERAEIRVRDLIESLKSGDWSKAFEITWAEFWDMHALFETSHPPFGYMTSGSLEVLNFVREEFWQKSGRGPLVTMDAGPNVHLLYRPDSVGSEQAARLSEKMGVRYRVISNLKDQGE